jgi:hypothetical protein
MARTAYHRVVGPRDFAGHRAQPLQILATQRRHSPDLEDPRARYGRERGLTTFAMPPAPALAPFTLPPYVEGPQHMSWRKGSVRRTDPHDADVDSSQFEFVEIFVEHAQPRAIACSRKKESTDQILIDFI